MHPTPAPPLSLLACSLALLMGILGGFAACGEPTIAKVPAGDNPVDRVSVENSLVLRVDGKERSCLGTIKNSSMTLNKTELHLSLTGQLTQQADRLGPELVLSVTKNDLSAGAFPLVSNIYALDGEDKNGAYVKWISSGDQQFVMNSVEGMLHLESLETTEEGFTNYGILHVKGRVEGTFLADGERHDLSGSFEFTR